MRDSPLYEAAAYGVVPAQFVVGGVYLAGRFGVVPVSPLLLLLVLAHLAAPVTFVLSPEGDGQLRLLEWWDFPILSGEALDTARSDGTGDDGWPLEPASRRKRRAFLFAAATTALSLVGAALVYAVSP